MSTWLAASWTLTSASARSSRAIMFIDAMLSQRFLISDVGAPRCKLFQAQMGGPS